MSKWFEGIILYLVFVILWTGVLKIFKLLIDKLNQVVLDRVKREQKSYLLKNDLRRIVKSFKREMFIEDKINRITPYFPLRMKKDFSDEELLYEIRKKNDLLFFYIKRLSPFKSINIIFILLIFHIYNINLFYYFLRFLNWDNLKKMGNPLPFIPASLSLILIIVALYFISRSGLFRKAKNKVTVEEIENKIKFHKQNRILLSSLLYEGYQNIEHIYLKRKSVISEVNKKKEQDDLSISFDWLKNIEGIEELDKFMKELESKNKDLFPFLWGVHHTSFFRLHELYNEMFTKNIKREDKFNEIFFTKKYMETVIKNKYFVSNFEDKLNAKILKSIKTMIYIEKYLDIVNKQINKPQSIYSFFAFITNKDK